jgi:hypothetical protein
MSTNTAGQTRRLWHHGSVGPASSQCTYTILVSRTMVHLIICSTRKRCTSTRWIHSDYRFWVSFGIHLQFCLKAFWMNLSNSSHKVRRLNFLSWVASAHRFTHLLCWKFFVVIGNSISIFLYTGRSMYVYSYSSLSSELIRRGATLLTTVFGGYQRRAATWWLQLGLDIGLRTRQLR